MKRRASTEGGSLPPPAKRTKNARNESVSTPTTVSKPPESPLPTPVQVKKSFSFLKSRKRVVTASPESASSPQSTPLQGKETLAAFKKKQTLISSKNTPVNSTPLSLGKQTPLSKSTPVIATPSSAKLSRIKGILKTDSIKKPAQASSPNRNVSFHPEASVTETLEKMRSRAATASEVNSLLAHLDNNKGKGLVLCLEDMRRFVACFDREYKSVIDDIINIHWSSHEQEVMLSFQKFALSLVSHHHFYSKVVIRSFLRQFLPVVEDGFVKTPNTPFINRQIHTFLKKFLKKFAAEKKDLMKQGTNMFPYFRVHSDKLVAYSRGWLQFYSYVIDRRQDILEIAFEKLIQIDAGINREHARSYVNQINKAKKAEEENEDKDEESNKDAAVHTEETEDDKDEDEELKPLDPIQLRLCENIDQTIKVFFKFLREQAFDKLEKTGEVTENAGKGSENTEKEIKRENGEAGKDRTEEKLEDNVDYEYEDIDKDMNMKLAYNEEKAKELEILVMKLFKSHILTSNRLLHVQFLVFYMASHSKEMSSNFLKLNWTLFTSVNEASVLRQEAITYLAGFICRSVIISVKTAKKWLKKIAKWIHAYLSGDGSHDVDYMVVNLPAHGHMYSACQALFYIIAFRHRDFVQDDDVSFLRSLELNTIISHPLNPLRVISPPVLKVFSKVVAFYQISYCNNIIQRNKRITLPVVGLSSGSLTSGKALLLDDYFPFDPYLLPLTRHLIDPLYRVYEPLEDDDSDSDTDGEEEEDNQDFEYVLEDQDTEEKMLDSYTRRKRTVSTSSTSSRRSRTTSLTDTINKALIDGI